MITCRQVLLICCLAFHTAAANFDIGILGRLFPEDFFKAPNIGNIEISPSGERFIYTFSLSGLHNFYVVDVETMEKKFFVGKNVEKDYVNFVDWKDEERIIFQTRFGNIYLLDLNDNKRTLLFDSERVIVSYFAIFWGNYSLPRVLSLLPEDSDGVLISALDNNGVRQVYRVDLESGERERLFRNFKRFEIFHADLQGRVRMAFKSSPRKLEFFYRSVKSDKWIPFDKVFKGQELKGFDLDKYNITQRREYFLAFDFNPEHFYFASNKLRDTATLYKYDMASQSVLEEVAHDPEYDFIDPLRHRTFAAPSYKRKKWVGFFIDREYPAMHWIDPFFSDLQARVDEQLPGSKNLLTGWNRAETVFLVNAIRSNRPVEYYLYKIESGELIRIGSANEDLMEVEMPESRPIRFVSRDGLSIAGYLTQAKPAVENGPGPLIMLVHGGPWIRDSYGFDPVVQWLVYNGFSVMQINFRGSTGYGYEHFYSIKRDFGWGVQNDIEDGVNWAVENGYADPDKVAIMGMSYGGYASVLALTSRPEKYRCGVAISGIYDLTLATRNVKEGSDSGLSYESWKTMVGTEWKDRNTLHDISPINHIDALNKPVLVVHGKRDEVANFEQAELLVAALQTQDKQYEWLEVEDEGHGFILPKNQAMVFEAVVEFLKSNLMPPS